jgi:hypothetical protein
MPSQRPPVSRSSTVSPYPMLAAMTEAQVQKLVGDCIDALETETGGGAGQPQPRDPGESPTSARARRRPQPRDPGESPTSTTARERPTNDQHNKSADFLCSPCPGSAMWMDSLGSLNMITEEHTDGLIGSVTQVRVRPAMDSGACDNVIDPDDLPDDCVIIPNETGKHFRGANDSVIENYGDVETILESDLGAIGCGWKGAAVPRPLHSVSKVAGPPGGIKNSKQDVLFNNDVCVVVPPGIVAEILKRVTPVASYAREGNLYVGDFVLSSFTRHGPQA